MAAVLATTERNLQFSGTSVTVPAGDLPAISYYMSCVDSVLVAYNISRAITDFQNTHRLRYEDQNTLIALCVLFNPMEIIDKLIIVDDDYKLLPRGNSNKFCDLSEVTSVVAVSADTLVGGQQTKITKIMLCTTEWVEKYWVRPMRNLKLRVAAVAEKSIKEMDEYLAAVELKLKLGRLQELMGRLDVSSSTGTPETKHCGHCKGLGAACACKERCPRKFGSECLDHPGVTCDRCKKEGLRGPRFKCRECYDYDLCSSCYRAEKDEHVRHSFLQIMGHEDSGTNISPRVQCDHPTVTCDMCKTEGLDGARFQCRECYNYDLCHKCYQTENDTHLQCRFWLIPKEGDSKVDMPPRVQKPAPTPVVQNTPAKPIYSPSPIHTSSPDPPVVEAYPINPDYDPFYASQQTIRAPDPTPVQVAAVQVDNFSQGQNVRLHGLSDAAMNGKMGVVDKVIPGGKYVVAIPDVGKKVFQAKNMEVFVEDPNYPLNACVELTGLSNTLENGKYGVIIGHDIDRISVKLFDEERTLKVRKENVLVIDEAG